MDNRLHRNIQRCRRFVQNDKVGLHRHRAGDADTGLLTARELMWKSVEQIDRQTNLLRKFLAAGADSGPTPNVSEPENGIGDCPLSR